jgi:hypothetical protein
MKVASLTLLGLIMDKRTQQIYISHVDTSRRTAVVICVSYKQQFRWQSYMRVCVFKRFRWNGAQLNILAARFLISPEVTNYFHSPQVAYARRLRMDQAYCRLVSDMTGASFESDTLSSF